MVKQKSPSESTVDDLDEQVGPDPLDISVFEIPPAAAYFESIQQLQKVQAKLDVMIEFQCEILAALKNTDLQSQKGKANVRMAKRYESLLLRYFEETDIDPESLLASIHPADRARELED